MSDTQPLSVRIWQMAAQFRAFLRRIGLFTSLLTLGALVLPPFAGIALIYFMPEISAYLRSHEQSGPFLYAVAFAILAGTALLPTYAQSALGGYAFGMWIGLAGALAGFAGGAIIGYFVASRASGDRVTRLIHENPKWQAVRDALIRDHDAAGGGGRGGSGLWKTTGMVALLRMPPNSPFALTNLVMASVKVPLAPFVVGTVVGMLPRTAAAVWIGSAFGPTAEGKFDTPMWLRITGIDASVIVLFIVMFIADRAVKKVTGMHKPPPGGRGQGVGSAT